MAFDRHESSNDSNDRAAGTNSIDQTKMPRRRAGLGDVGKPIDVVTIARELIGHYCDVGRARHFFSHLNPHHGKFSEGIEFGH